MVKMINIVFSHSQSMQNITGFPSVNDDENVIELVDASARVTETFIKHLAFEQVSPYVEQANASIAIDTSANKTEIVDAWNNIQLPPPFWLFCSNVAHTIQI